MPSPSRGENERRTQTSEAKAEAKAVEARKGLRSPVIYEVVRRHGEEEMARPSLSLWWSGVAGGLSISFSLLAQALLHLYLPDHPWRILVARLGYSVGFLMVILSRQQLFTETTITAVLPVMADFTRRNVGYMLRMWGIVWIANTVGTLAAASFCTFTPAITPDLRDAMIEVSRHAIHGEFADSLFRAIPAGFLMAATVWLLPSARSAQFWVIAMMTYLIALGGFAHIVAGSVEAWMLVTNGDLGFGSMLLEFTVPVLLGNMVGGTALFALLSYAQVMKEI